MPRTRPGEIGIELALHPGVSDARRTSILAALGHCEIEMNEPHAQTLTGTFISVTGLRVLVRPDGSTDIQVPLLALERVVAIP